MKKKERGIYRGYRIFIDLFNMTTYADHKKKKNLTFPPIQVGDGIGPIPLGAVRTLIDSHLDNPIPDGGSVKINVIVTPAEHDEMVSIVKAAE